MFRMPVDATLDLVLLEPRHAPLLFSLVDENRAHLRRYLPWVDGTRAVNDSVGYITASLEQFARSQSLQVGLFTDGSLVGMCGYHMIDWNNRRTGIGYWLAQSHQGKGLMTRAVRALTTHAFGHKNAAHAWRPHHSSWMELHKLHVHQFSAGLIRKRVSVAGAFPTIAGDAE